jgi:DNA-binding response OmpR family regulator
MLGSRRILVIDDDEALRLSLSEQLQHDGEFVCTEADSGERALALVDDGRFDAILLDLGLPDADGRDICREMRRRGVTAPIIMLTAADSESDTVLGRDDAEFTIGPYKFRPGAKLMTDAAGRKKVRLTEKETAILKYLYRAGDQAIGRDTLLGEVWGYNAGVTTHTLETHVYRLRQKIERDPTRAEILVTEPGGYRLLP